MSSAAINQLLKNNSVWQASQKGGERPAVTTGYKALDEALHYAGWPQGGLTELLLSKNGIGEIRLLTPLLAELGKNTGYNCWINPPFQPYAPALMRQQINLNQLLIIRTKSLQETIWAAQQAMASNACSTVFLWLPPKTLNKEIRKLALASKTGNCWGFIFRAQQFHAQPSAATLRIVMSSTQGKQHLNIIKQPGGWSGQQVSLELFPERAYWSAQPVQEWPVINRQPLHRQSVSNENTERFLSGPRLGIEQALDQPLNNHKVSSFH